MIGKSKAFIHRNIDVYIHVHIYIYIYLKLKHTSLKNQQNVSFPGKKPLRDM